MSKRPIPQPHPITPKHISTFKQLGITNASNQTFDGFLMRGIGGNPGSIPKGSHENLWMNDCELTIAPGASTSVDKPKWLRRHYCIRNGGMKNVIGRGIDYDDTVQEHWDYGNVFANYTIDGFLAELIGSQAIQLCSYNTNSSASGKNNRVLEVGQAYYDTHVHDTGVISIKNGTISECGLPEGDRPSYALSCFPGEQDVHLKNLSITCLAAPPHLDTGKVKRYSYGAIHVSGRTGYLQYSTPNPYQSPRSLLVQDIYCNFKLPDRDVVEIKDIAGTVMFAPGSEWVTGKVALRNCKGDIDISGQVGKAILEVDGKIIGPITKGFQRKAI